MGTLHGHAALARAWERAAETEADHARAQAYAQATSARMAELRAARSTAAHGPAVLTPSARAVYETALHDQAVAEQRAARFEALSDDALMDGDDHAARRYAALADHHRTHAATAAQTLHALTQPHPTHPRADRVS
ncbi:MAG: hypothetical protein HGA44_06840 [Cellulomonadaceae bacterium]|nr:hypothetical protein [Cellulomonadaceae bacterium]